MYWLFVLGSILLIFAFNMIRCFTWSTALDLAFVIVCILLPSIIALFFERILPYKCFDATQSFYKSKKNERKFYDKIKVKNWKDKIPNWGKVGQVRESENQLNIHDVEKFIFQTCLGEIVHDFCVISSLISAIILMIKRPDIFLNMALPIFIVYAIVNMLSIIIQRYNRPRLQLLLERMKRSEHLQNTESSVESEEKHNYA